jgi:pimeloyl-ACP methyl ester carboxylesterase
LLAVTRIFLVYVEELRFDIEGVRLFVRAWGERDDRPLLCWHGVGARSRASALWKDAGPLLAGKYGLRVLALDAPGFGQSSPAEVGAYGPQALVDLVPPLLEALELDRVAFAGYSWGGDVGCHFAARHPESLTALVLLDSGFSDPPLDPSLSFERRKERNETIWQQTDAPTVPAWVVAAVEHGMAHAAPSATRPALAESGPPIMLVAAGDAPEADLAQFAADVPQVEIVRAEGTGHDILVDGWPDVVHLVGAWLAANDSTH